MQLGQLGLLLSPAVSINFFLKTNQKKHKKGPEQQRQTRQVLVVVGGRGILLGAEFVGAGKATPARPSVTKGQFVCASWKSPQVFHLLFTFRVRGRGQRHNPFFPQRLLRNAGCIPVSFQTSKMGRRRGPPLAGTPLFLPTSLTDQSPCHLKAKPSLCSVQGCMRGTY